MKLPAALTPTQSRYAALVLLLAVLSLVVVAIAWPVLRLHQHYNEHIEEYSDHLSRFRRVAALRPDIESAVAAVTRQDGHKFYLQATTSTLAAAELQNQVTKIIESQQGRIISSQSLPAKEDMKGGKATKVAVSVQMAAAMVPLQLILHRIESTEPYLFIDQVTIRSTQGRAYRPVPGVQPEVSVQLTVGAYALPTRAKQ